MKILTRGLITIALGTALAALVFVTASHNPFTATEMNTSLVSTAYALMFIPAYWLAMSTLDEVFYYRMGYQGNREPWFVPDLNLVLIVASLLLINGSWGYELDAIAQIIVWVAVAIVAFVTLHARSRQFKRLEVVRFVDAEVEDGEHG